MKYVFVCVDFQNDFTEKGGLAYMPRESIKFIKKVLIPTFREKGIKIIEIVSDYRQPRPGDRGDCCHPGEWGYNSQIPSDVKNSNIWIKSMNSPLWLRENIGEAKLQPGLPYQDTEGFNKWLRRVLGESIEKEVVLFGLTTDCCVLCLAQEISFRGYKVKILNEATDTYSGSVKEKEFILQNPPLINWAKPISWKEIVKDLDSH